MAKRKDKIPGGVADKKKVKDFSAAALKQGAKVELEHTSNKAIAKEIAMDHLAEDKNYYKKLKTIHKSDDGEVDAGNKPLPLPDFFNKHEGLIPKDHKDYQRAIEHITKEYKNNKNESNRLHDRYIGGGGKYIKDKVMNKASMIEVAPDGKQEIVEGRESLKKPKSTKPAISMDPVMDYDKVGPKPKTEKQQKEYEARVKAFSERWNKLKKALSNSAILDLHEEMHPDDEQAPPEQGGQVEQGPSEEDMQAMEQQEQGQQPPQDQTQPEEQQMQEQPQEQPEDHSKTEQELMDALKNEGYSDPEIAYIVHGIMAPQISEAESAKADATRAMGDIDVDSKRQNLDTDLSHKKRSMDLEHEHAKRMKDLEFEHAKMQSPEPELDKEHRRCLLDIELQERELDLERKRQEMALEMEFKRRELELKLKHADEAAKRKLQDKDSMQVSKKTGAKNEQD